MTLGLPPAPSCRQKPVPSGHSGEEEERGCMWVHCAASNPKPQSCCERGDGYLFLRRFHWVFQHESWGFFCTGQLSVTRESTGYSTAPLVFAAKEKSFGSPDWNAGCLKERGRPLTNCRLCPSDTRRVGGDQISLEPQCDWAGSRGEERGSGGAAAPARRPGGPRALWRCRRGGTAGQTPLRPRGAPGPRCGWDTAPRERGLGLPAGCRLQHPPGGTAAVLSACRVRH